MGQKVNPIGLRLGVNKTWQSRWYADSREYADLFLEDMKIRKLVGSLPECKNADIAEIEIVRHPQRVTIVIHTARPGVIIGVKGATIEKISADIQKQLTKKVQIKIKEIKRPEINASLIAECRPSACWPRFFPQGSQAVCFKCYEGRSSGYKNPYFWSSWRS